MQTVTERRYDAEICPSTTNSPEQIGVLLLAGSEHLTIGGDHIYRQQVVTSCAVFSHQISKSAPESQPGNSCVGDLPSGGRQTVSLSGAIELTPKQTSGCRSFPRDGVHADLFHQ